MKRTILSTALTASLSLLWGASSKAETLIETDFLHKATLSFPGYTGEAELVNFPVLVRLSPATMEGFSYEDAAEGGADLHFADANGNLLAHEIELWNPEGESLIWVRVPSLTADTHIFAYYAGPHAVQPSSATWQDYAGVWHMAEASGTAYDSTANGLDGTPKGAKASSMVATAGIVGNARTNSGSTDGNSKSYLSIPNYNHLGLGNTFTLSGWFKSTGINGYPRYFSRKNNFNDNDGWEIEAVQNNNSKITARGVKNDKTVQPDIPNVTADWVFLSFVYDNTTLSVYANGVLAKSGTIDPATDNGRPMSIGCDSDGSETTFGGQFDEVRLRDGCLDANWIATEYATIKNADFVACGPVEPVLSDIPSLGLSEVLSTAFHEATISYNLFRTGSPEASVVIAYGTSPEALTETNIIVTAAETAGVATHTLSGLRCTTTYYAQHVASNPSGTGASSIFSFTTPGYPALGTASVLAEDTSVTITGSLTDIGVTATTVELYFGSDPDNLALVQTWPALSAPQDLSFSINNLPFATYIAKFRAYNVCEGVTHEIWSDEARDTIYGTVTWTGAAGDSDWNNPNNWNTHTVPGFKDTAILTSTGLSNNQTLHFSQNQAVAALVIDTPYALTFGDTADTEAGYSLTIGDLTRVDTEGNEGRLTFAIKIALTSSTSDLMAYWDLQGNGEFLVTGGIIGSIPGVGLTKSGSANMALNSEASYTGNTIVLEGSIKRPNWDDFRNGLGGTVIIGSPDGTAYASYEASKGGRPKNAVVYQNGYYHQGDWPGMGYLTVYGGRVSLSWANIDGDIKMTGGIVTGGPLERKGANIYSYSAPTTAKIESDFRMNEYESQKYLFDVEDGEAPIDMWCSGSFALMHKDSTMTKRGDGVIRFSGKGSTFTENTFNLNAGTLLIDNPSGAGLGKAPVRVNAGATLGGTGFLGGKEGYTVANITATGSTDKPAIIAPGSLDDETGAHVYGTLTVGSEAQANSVTFGANSQLCVGIGPEGAADCLKVYGTVDLSTDSDQILLSVDPDAVPGTYVLLEATEGITGTFAQKLTAKPRCLSQTDTTITYLVPPPNTLILFR